MPDLAINPKHAGKQPAPLLPRPASGVIATVLWLSGGWPAILVTVIHMVSRFGNPRRGTGDRHSVSTTVLTRGCRTGNRPTGGKRSAPQGHRFRRWRVGYLDRFRVGSIAHRQPRHRHCRSSDGWFGESQFVTGCVSGRASVGPQRAGMSMSWTGIAMFAALSIGAGWHMALYQHYSLAVASADGLHCCTGPGCADRAGLFCVYLSPGGTIAILSGDRTHLARRAGADAAGCRLIPDSPLWLLAVLFAAFTGRTPVWS